MERKPRTRGKIRVDYTSKDMYKFYLDKYTPTVTNSKYTAICKDFNRAISEAILYGYDYSCFSRLGRHSIKKRKKKIRLDAEGNVNMNNLPIDYRGTEALWNTNPEAKAKKQLVRHLNEHSDGYIGIWFWEKQTACNIPNKTAYHFTLCRENKRALGKIFKGNFSNIDYYEC